MHTQPEFLKLRQHMQSVIVGQAALLDRILIGVLTGGHLLLEGAPGLAKTTAVKALASGVHASFQRIQFTPDLMPADLTGSEVFDPQQRRFDFMPGPLFHEIILADEINRAPPKVQSALLEAMEEHQITVGAQTHPLPALFIVMATQNPLEQAGTYPLPEAQLDRFLLHVTIDYPSQDEELAILRRDRQTHFGEDRIDLESRLQPDTVLKARHEVAEVHIEPTIEEYVVRLTHATRHLGEWIEEWADYIDFGASPRATLALVRAASAYAYLQGREYVIPDDVIEMAPDVLRHRILPSFNAKAKQVTSAMIIARLLERIPIP
ncbi:MAG: AAA domain-containing protein [Gammaproteobacteria bacterium]|nr:AAA domain-containing protein [Gammaproteobacteria bacterium]